MKRIFLSIFACCLAFVGLHAEDVLQILPQQIVPGSDMEEEENYFTIEMNNEHTFVALQFDLWLPEGITIEDAYFSLNKERMPYKGKKFYHNITCVKQSTGQYRITCSSTDSDNNQIKNNSGVLFAVYYSSDADIQTGILPIRITDVVMALNGMEGVRYSACTSFFYTPDVDFSTLTSIDLTTAEGVTTQNVSAAARTLMTSPNSLLYLNEGSAADGLQNVVVGSSCENLVLTDAMPFNAPKAFIAESASYTRTLANDGWYSLCLPFAAETPAGVQVERFCKIEDNVISFLSGDIEADVPCIFNAKAGMLTFSASNATVSETPDALIDGKLAGTYDLLPEGTITGNYILRADGTGFATASATAWIQPFRAMVNNVSGARFLALKHGDIVPTGIEGIQNSSLETQNCYNLQGQKVQGNYKGIIITNGKKLFNK